MHKGFYLVHSWILCPIWEVEALYIEFLHQTFYIENLKGADLKNNSFFKMQPKNTQIHFSFYVKSCVNLIKL